MQGQASSDLTAPDTAASHADTQTSPDRIVDIQLDEKTLVRRKPEVEHERNVAIFDLLDQNYFRVAGVDGVITGPYHVLLSVKENRLTFDIRDTAGAALTALTLPLSPFRTIVKDYFMICESYYSAIKTLSPSQIEAIDMGRRGLHDEGAALLVERLEGKVSTDKDTARRLFTLICILHIRG